MAVKTMMAREGGWGALLYACCISPLFYLRLLSRRATGREQYLTWSVRCGYPSLSRPSGPLLWFHAVSIGTSLARMQSSWFFFFLF
jgi:3-deoxy-D-manno-octulosonic-acid transferase